MSSLPTAIDYDRSPELVEIFEQAARWFIPGYDVSHALAAVLLHDRIGDDGHILVVGAGGGVEISALAQGSAWRFAGVDISADMLAGARRKLAAAGVDAARVELVQGRVEDVAATGFDAATAFLVLHFIPDDGARLAALRAIRARLRPGAPFLMIDGCADMDGPDFEDGLRLGAAAALRNGAPPAMAAEWVAMQRARGLALLPVEREEALLAEAGFGDIRQFYRALWITGWIARA